MEEQYGRKRATLSTAETSQQAKVHARLPLELAAVGREGKGTWSAARQVKSDTSISSTRLAGAGAVRVCELHANLPLELAGLGRKGGVGKGIRSSRVCTRARHLQRQHLRTGSQGSGGRSLRLLAASLVEWVIVCCLPSCRLE